MRVPLEISLCIVRWMQPMREILGTMRDARFGGVVAKTFAAFAIAGVIAEQVAPRWGPSLTLKRYGYEKVPTSAATFFIDLLHESKLIPKTLSIENGDAIHLWTPPGAKRPTIATTRSKYQGDNLFSFVGVDPTIMFRDLVWKKGDDLMVSVDTTRSEDIRYMVRTMGAPGTYVGDPSPTKIASRVSVIGKGTRSILLVGPTGSGKSTLARLVAREIAGSDARTLKIAGSVLNLCSFGVVLDLASYLRPTVLLLDDVPLSERSRVGELLTLLEALHGRIEVIISTYMDDNPEHEDGADGSDYWPGMRPGRIDEVVRTRRPSLEDRVLILQEYFAQYGVMESAKEVALACDGLTGAYLREVAYRLSCGRRWQDEVCAVRRTAPGRVETPNQDEHLVLSHPPSLRSRIPASAPKTPFVVAGESR